MPNVKYYVEKEKNSMDYSISPEGEKFKLPEEQDYKKEYGKLQKLAKKHKAEGREVLWSWVSGSWGAVMAGVVADSVDKKTGKPSKLVIGMQRPSSRSFWKIPLFNRGVSPVNAEDPEVAPLIERCVTQKKSLVATYTYDALKLADVLVVDVQCDFLKEELGNLRSGYADISALEESFKIIGEKIDPGCLVLIETTVPPGTTEYVAYPLIKKAFRKRGLKQEPLLAHSFERVMPGRDYVKSVRDFWRVCSGINEESRERVVRFLSAVLNVEKYPLTVLDRPLESETCKIVENSYRATILAFLDEWSLFAETNGVDLIKVIKAIKVRPTHSNIIFPGPGIGGYCLPKDGGLGLWAYKHLLGFESDIFKITPQAININDTRGLRAAQLVRDALETWAASLPPPRSRFWGHPTAKMWETPATAAPRSSCASLRKWAPRSRPMIPMFDTGGSWKSRMPIRRQGRAGPGSFATRST
jgi:UDP-N-acetyl-D-glucosamine dehydrogenase